MSKKFEIGDRRFIVVKKDEIRMFEDGSSRLAVFTFPRWSQFVQLFDEIDSNVTKLFAGQKDVGCNCTWAAVAMSASPLDIRVWTFGNFI